MPTQHRSTPSHNLQQEHRAGGGRGGDSIPKSSDTVRRLFQLTQAWNCGDLTSGGVPFFGMLHDFQTGLGVNFPRRQALGRTSKDRTF